MKNKKKTVTVEELLNQEEETTQKTDAKETDAKMKDRDDVSDHRKTEAPNEEADGETETKANDVDKTPAKEKADETSKDDNKDAPIDASENEEIAVRYLRLQADFQNFKRRSEEEQKNTVRYANERLILQLLDVVDNFERALATEKEHDSFFLGMEMIHSQLREILEKNGVEAILADGEAFDPNLHHAVLTEESADVDEGHVIETLQTGYKLNGKLIRPAMVKVAK